MECVFIESNEYNTQNIHSILYEFIQSVKFVNVQPSDLLFIEEFSGSHAVCNQSEYFSIKSYVYLCFVSIFSKIYEEI